MRFRTTIALWLLVSLSAPALAAPPDTRPTWIFFTQDGCGPCITAKKMQQDPRVQAWAKHFRCVVVDFKTNRKLAERYRLEGTPADVFVPYNPVDGVGHTSWPRPAKDSNAYAWRFAVAYQKYVKPDFLTATVEPSYPLRPPGAAHWYGCKDYRHLLTREHAGNFDEGWLSRRPLAEILALHADHHEELLGIGKVQWQYVIRPAPTVAKR